MIRPYALRLSVIALAAFPASLPFTLAAQEACVCLEHIATEQLYKGCTLIKGPSDVFATAVGCRGSDSGEDGETATDFSVTSSWRKIPEGEGKCSVCRSEERLPFTVPRN